MSHCKAASGFITITFIIIVVAAAAVVLEALISQWSLTILFLVQFVPLEFVSRYCISVNKNILKPVL